MNAWLEAIPLWAIFAAIAVVIPLAIEGGYRIGRRRSQQADLEKESPVATAVAAALGLLAFLLAFTFGLAANRFETRRSVLLEEVNAIGTAYLRAGLLPEPHGSKVRRLLREYVDARLAAVQQNALATTLRRSDELHRDLWAEVVAVAEREPRSIPVGLFIESVNSVIDLHTLRVTAATRSHIPAPIWLALSGVAIATLWAMGYHSGLTRTRRSPATLAVVASLAITIWLIADLDRSQQGLLRLSQQPMIDLQRSMQEPGPN